jgi:hypothetical protein
MNILGKPKRCTRINLLKVVECFPHPVLVCKCDSFGELCKLSGLGGSLWKQDMYADESFLGGRIAEAGQVDLGEEAEA